jgi:hypothetical protein
MSRTIQAIDAVVNLHTPEALAYRPDRRAFYAKMRVPAEIYNGFPLETMLAQMDAAGTERAMLIAAKVGPKHHPACYHTPYSLVRDAVQRFPDRFYALAGLDPTEGMQGVRELERAVREDGFIGAHFYPHWFELPPFTQNALSSTFPCNCKLDSRWFMTQAFLCAASAGPSRLTPWRATSQNSKSSASTSAFRGPTR